MNRILVSGVVNMETTLKVDSFPLVYEPVRYPFWGVQSTISGAGFNITKGLSALGSSVHLLSFVGKDKVAGMVNQVLDESGIQKNYILSKLTHTPQSVVIYDNKGDRQIHTDLKDINERDYPKGLYEQAIEGCSLAIHCNVEFSRPLIKWTQNRGVPIATDVHAISQVDDAYNQDFMKAASILFMSGEKLPKKLRDLKRWVKKLQNQYGTSIIVVGRGKNGVLMAIRDDNFMEKIPAQKVRPIVNTIGAGDALFSSFNHFYSRTGDPYSSIEKAIVFTSYKIGEAGAAQGFLSENELEEIFSKIQTQ